MARMGRIHRLARRPTAPSSLRRDPSAPWSVYFQRRKEAERGVCPAAALFKTSLRTQARGRLDVVKRGALLPVKITVETRTGNKKARPSAALRSAEERSAAQCGASSDPPTSRHLPFSPRLPPLRRSAGDARRWARGVPRRPLRALPGPPAALRSERSGGGDPVQREAGAEAAVGDRAAGEYQWICGDARGVYFFWR